MKIFINVHPVGYCQPQLTLFLLERYGKGSIKSYNNPTPDFICSVNGAIMDALNTKEKHFIFIEGDMIIGPKSLPFFKEADKAKAGQVTCAKYPTHGTNPWGSPTAFHTGMWSVSRAILEEIGAPWFTNRYNSTYSGHVDCGCSSFRQRVLGFSHTIKRVGSCGHVGQGKA